VTLSGPFGVSTSDPVFQADLATAMNAVEQLLRDSVKSDYSFVSETSRHLIDAGGKRFRPLLVLLGARFGDAQAPGILPAAVAVELTHLATLYHDDVMDEAAIRRGAPSANARWGNSVAILTGDFLFARASDISVELGLDAIRAQARTFERLVSGQIRETLGPDESEDPVDHYLSVVADKTGSLIASAGRLGAQLAGADEVAIDVLARFGERIGVAFQLSDDLLDVMSESASSGKMPGTDLREGVATLPVLHVRRAAEPSDARLLELLDADLTDDTLHAEALQLLRAHPAMADARATVKAWADDARAVLEPLPPGPPREALESLCDVIVTRSA
jgi:heptaprenyl diphosphate synthase